MTKLVPQLTKLAKNSSAHGRVHAMWALAGLKSLDQTVIDHNLSSTEWLVNLTALRLAGEATGNPHAFPMQFAAAAEKLGKSKVKLVADYAGKVVKTGYPNRFASVYKDKMASWVKSDKELDRAYRSGMTVYGQYCAACHQPTGQGLKNVAPTLVKSDWVNGDPTVLISVAMNGLTGPIKVNGKPVTDVPPIMPPHMFLKDDQMADALTYARNAWGNKAGRITATQVKAFRAKHGKRVTPWTETELR